MKTAHFGCFSRLAVSLSWFLNSFLFFVSPVWAAGTPVDLQMCFQSAVQKSELLLNQEEQITQVREQKAQAIGGVLPKVSADGTYFFQQTPTDPIAQQFFPAAQPTVKLTVAQPIFRGLREFARLKQLGRLTEAQELEKRALEVSLFREVTQNYFLRLKLEQELKNLAMQVDLFEDRVKELSQRARIGQSNTSEVLTAQATKAQTLAEVKFIAGSNHTAEETFTFLTGLPQETQLVVPIFQIPTSLDLGRYLTAMEQRPDIQSAKQMVEAAEQGIRIAQGGHLPSVDVLGNYYLVRPTGVFSEIRWDVQATLTLPLFSGGIIQSQVKEASSLNRQSELTLSRVRRKAEQEVRSLYASVQSDLERVQALQESMKLSERNYQVLERDYRKGLTRNIEVLQSLSLFQQSKRALDNARLSVQSDYLLLEIVSAAKNMHEVP